MVMWKQTFSEEAEAVIIKLPEALVEIVWNSAIWSIYLYNGYILFNNCLFWR